MDVCRYGQIALIVWIFCWCLPAAQLQAQGSDQKLNQKVKLASRTVRLDSLLQQVTKQTGIKFSYNSRKINTAYKVQLATVSPAVKEILETLRKNTSTQYTVLDNQVILNIEKSTLQKPPLSSATSLAPAQKTRPDTITLTQKTEPPAIGNRDKSLPTDTISQQEESKNAPASVVSNASMNVPDKPTTPATTSVSKAKPDSAKTSKPITNSVREPKRQDVKPASPYFIDIGISTEETLFLGATIQGGLPKLFGSVSVKSNGRSVLFLYGLGTSLTLNKTARIILTASYCPYTENFNYTRENPDTTITDFTIAVKGSLTRIGTGVEWQLGSKGQWRAYTGITFNALQSKYNVNGERVGLSVTGIANADRDFSVLNPLYTITDSYSGDKPTALKTWLGLQLGIAYRIKFR